MSKVTLLKGDITKLTVDAIVNAANTSLMGGGGVDGAIHKQGGPKILAECMLIRNKQGGCDTGEAVITSAGNLKARFVIHTVGPVWRGGNAQEELLLKNCYENSLNLALQFGVRSIAFPNISTGVYHFPKEKAATIAIQAVRDFIERHPIIEEVIFCCFDQDNYQLYHEFLND
jgi:O-acetyl-ADP-ribose deacetylase (regulator of RNase III)